MCKHLSSSYLSRRNIEIPNSITEDRSKCLDEVWETQCLNFRDSKDSIELAVFYIFHLSSCSLL